MHRMPQTRDFSLCAFGQGSVGEASQQGLQGRNGLGQVSLSLGGHGGGEEIVLLGQT
jgi:hypothetical protein